MKDEIKEILNEIGYHQHIHENLTLSPKELDILVDYITNLREEVEDLREDNYAYHQLIRMENKREYRSKFLKEFQEEFGTNTFPDYDEIYKRYDKVKKENERLSVELNKNMIERNNYLSRNEKAIDKIQYIIDYGFDYDGFNTVESLKGLIDMLVDYARQSKDILQGSDKE